ARSDMSPEELTELGQQLRADAVRASDAAGSGPAPPYRAGMVTADDIARQVGAALLDEYRERLRRALLGQPKEWLADELLARLDGSRDYRAAAPGLGGALAALVDGAPPRSTSAQEPVRERAPGPGAPPAQEGPAPGPVGECGPVRDVRPVGVSSGSLGDARPVGDPRPPGKTGPAEDAGPLAESAEERARRRERLRACPLDRDALAERVARLGSWTRERLEAEGLLIDPPAMGGPLIAPAHRSPAGEALLLEAKDLLYALLSGDADDGVRLDRVERELLSLTLPRAKAHSLTFLLRAATEIGAVGTWRDPSGTARDERPPNLLLQVGYGEVAGELVGEGLAAALRLINHLEVNEQVLYGRMENVEESAPG
ncbi:hypothetical protein ABZ579_31485, partial [Streptomyces thermolilacinus]